MAKYPPPGTFRNERLRKEAESRRRKEAKRMLEERQEQEVNKIKLKFERRLRTLTKQKINVKTLVPRNCKHDYVEKNPRKLN